MLWLWDLALRVIAEDELDNDFLVLKECEVSSNVQCFKSQMSFSGYLVFGEGVASI